jgi:hypothetical protein
MGLYGMAEDVGILIGPLVGGVLWDRGGPSLAFASFSIVYVVTCGLVALLLHEARGAGQVRARGAGKASALTSEAIST